MGAGGGREKSLGGSETIEIIQICTWWTQKALGSGFGSGQADHPLHVLDDSPNLSEILLPRL